MCLAIEVEACGDERGEADGTESSGAGKVHSAEGGCGREGGEGEVRDAEQRERSRQKKIVRAK